MDDKRLTHRLTEYWNEMRGDDSLPQWEDFNSGAFGELWRKCCGWKVDAANTSTIIYTYEYLGDAVREVTGTDLTGTRYSSVQKAPVPNMRPSKAAAEADMPGEMLANHFRNFPAARILQKIDRVVKKPAIVIEEGRVIDGKGRNIRFRSCLLPFGSKDGSVTHMVLGLSWKAY